MLLMFALITNLIFGLFSLLNFALRVRELTQLPCAFGARRCARRKLHILKSKDN